MPGVVGHRGDRAADDRRPAHGSEHARHGVHRAGRRRRRLQHAVDFAPPRRIRAGDPVRRDPNGARHRQRHHLRRNDLRRPMLAMLFSSIGSMVEGGLIIGIGLLLDTFLVRTITVPALAVLFGKYNWWPSRRDEHRDRTRADAEPDAGARVLQFRWCGVGGSESSLRDGHQLYLPKSTDPPTPHHRNCRTRTPGARVLQFRWWGRRMVLLASTTGGRRAEMSAGSADPAPPELQDASS